MRCTRYRPRQPRASPVWQILRDHAHRLTNLEPTTAQALARFQRCGHLHSGFTRLHCPDCGHDYLLAFTCKQRGLCASCHQRRTITEAAAIAAEICQDVPHRHLVLTLPRMLRGVFQREPALLGELYHATHEVLTLWLRDRAACPTGQPGLVVAVQTFGDYLLWHPHVHVLATAGVFTVDATFHLADTGGWETLRELWRHALLRRLREARALAPDTLARLLQWRHSGFGADGGEAPLANDDATGRSRLAEYLLRAPYSLEKITYHPESGTVLYRSERHWRTRRNFEVFSALDFIRALLGQVPAPGCPQVRYYGYYSNKSRGLRTASAASPLVGSPLVGDRAAPPPHAPARRPRRRKAWRDLIREVWGADPLRCPLCPGRLRPIAVVETPAEIHAALFPLGLAELALPPATGPPRKAPPCARPFSLVDTATGLIHEIAPPACPSRLPYPRLKTEKIRFRAEIAEPSETYDQLGFELVNGYRVAEPDVGQGELFDDDYSQPDALEGEPVFWQNSASEEPGFYPDEAPCDDGYQPDGQVD